MSSFVNAFLQELLWFFITALEIQNSKYVQCNRSLFVCAIVVFLNISDGVMMVQSDVSSVYRPYGSNVQLGLHVGTDLISMHLYGMLFNCLHFATIRIS